ncbi:MAG: AAA family ATPase, partial [Bacilli bacterium]|nr:AAA family ATPase [Bacilli bacterium]
MNKDFKNIASYIKEIIEMRNRNIYNYNDYDFSFSLEQLYNNYNEFIEMKKDVSILTTGVFLKIKYISERHKKPYPQVPEILNKYISLYKNEVIGEMDNFEEELKLNHLYQTYIDYVNKIFYINEYNKKIESYNKLYSNIYSYNKRIKDNEEKLEFILATNLMSWKFDKTNCILRHIFEAFLNIDVDPINNTISFSVNHELKKGFVVDFLNQNNFQIKDKVELYKFIDNFDNQISEVVDINFNEIIRKFANLISYENNIPNKSFFNYKYSKLVDKHTYIFDDQHIIIRKKNSKIWVEDLEKILEAAETEELDATIFKLLNADFDNSEEVESILKSNEESETEAEVLFPLATNTEQFNIVNRVRGSNIVLVEGPPGTGKSHTIANLISHFISEGKKIIITSEKAKALEVVREKLPKDIRSLSLSLLSTSSSDKDLEFSVNQILKRQEEKENSDNIKNKISFLTNKLVDIRKEKASNTRQIIDLMMLDTVNHQDALKNVVSGEMKNYNLIEIAQWLEKHERYDLIPDEDNENIEFTNLVEMFSSLDSVVNNIQNENYDISKEIKLQSYLSDNTLKQLSIKVNDNNQYKPKTENLKDAIILNNLNEKIISELEKNLNELNTLTLGFSKNWILENTKYPVFIDILTQIMKDISELKSIIYIVEKNNLYYKIDYDFSNIDDYIKSLETIIKIIDNESKINILQKAYFNRDIKIVKNIKIESQIKDCNILTHEVATVVFSKLIHD